MFYGNFKDKGDVCNEFSIPDFDGTVVFAAYETPDYEGYAEVIFIHNGKLFMAQGSHCSCHGLEQQWDPVEMPVDGLRRIITEGTGMLSHYRDHLNEVIDRIEELNLFEKSSDVQQVVLKLAFG